MTALVTEARRSAARGVFLFLFASLWLHLFEAKVGAWTAGSLGPLATLLVGVAAPAWFFVFFPTWFAWRVCRPLASLLPAGRAVLRELSLFACWLSPLVSRRDLASLRVFFTVEAEQPFPDAGAIPADAWTALAAALQAERQGNRVRAKAIVEALRCLPQESRFPWLGRCIGAEALALSAWRRGDFAAVLDYATVGRGRTVPLLVLLARAGLGERVRPRALWLAWSQSPIRRQTLQAVRSATARGRVPRKVTPAPSETSPVVHASLAVDVRLRHLSLLAAASRGEGVVASDLLALAHAWQQHLDKSSLARLSARALELDVRDASAQSQNVRTRVLAELIALAASCEGKLTAIAEESSLVPDLVTGLRERLCHDVEVALAGINPETYSPKIHPLEAWERWLTLRGALDRLAIQDGGAFVTLWNGRVAPTVWNWTCAVFNCHAGRAAWVAHMMYLWLAEQAELMGDIRTVAVNRENARIALGA
jgi:hypothetical protein